MGCYINNKIGENRQTNRDRKTYIQRETENKREIKRENDRMIQIEW